MTNKKPAKYSEYDNRGNLHIDCSECDRGANGTDKDKCSAGKHKRGNQGGCFLGSLLPTLKMEDNKNVA